MQYDGDMEQTKSNDTTFTEFSINKPNNFLLPCLYTYTV